MGTFLLGSDPREPLWSLGTERGIGGSTESFVMCLGGVTMDLVLSEFGRREGRTTPGARARQSALSLASCLLDARPETS